MENTPSILDYWDYRKFLQDFYTYKKKTRNGYSYRVFCKEADIKSPSLIKMVLDGQRNITSKSFDKFVKGIKLTDSRDINFFKLLVKFNQEKEMEKKTRFFEQVLEFKSKKEATKMDIQQVRILSNWHMVAICIMTELEDFKSDVTWIANKLKKRVSEKNITSALETLVDLKLIKKDEQGNFKLLNPSLVTPHKFRDQIVTHYHQNMLNLALQNLEEEELSRSAFTGTTLAVSEANFDELKQRIREFRNDLCDLARKSKSCQDVYQLNIQFFPLTSQE